MELGFCLIYTAEIDIRQAAKYNNDQELLQKIRNRDFGDGPYFTAMEVKYHHQPCKSEYLNKWRSSKKSLKPYPQINKLEKSLRKRSLNL